MSPKLLSDHRKRYYNTLKSNVVHVGLTPGVILQKCHSVHDADNSEIFSTFLICLQVSSSYIVTQDLSRAERFGIISAWRPETLDSRRTENYLALVIGICSGPFGHHNRF